MSPALADLAALARRGEWTVEVSGTLDAPVPN